MGKKASDPLGEPSVQSNKIVSRIDVVIDALRAKRTTAVVAAITAITAVVLAVSSATDGDDTQPDPVTSPRETAASDPGLNLSIYQPNAPSNSPAKQDTAPRVVGREQAKASPTKGPKIFRRPRDLAFPPGTMLKARLALGASNGPTKAVVTEPLVVGGEAVLDAGIVLLGHGQSSEERLFIHFDKVVFADGAVADLDGTAIDAEDQLPGLKGSRVGHYAAKVAGSIGLNFISGMAEGLKETQSYGPVTITAPTVKNALLNGTSRTAMEQAQDMMGSLKNDQPIIEVGAGTTLDIMLGSKG